MKLGQAVSIIIDIEFNIPKRKYLGYILCVLIAGTENFFLEMNFRETILSVVPWQEERKDGRYE